MVLYALASETSSAVPRAAEQMALDPGVVGIRATRLPGKGWTYPPTGSKSHNQTGDQPGAGSPTQRR